MDMHLLPTIFIALMGLAILVYAILDGYDLGIGIVLPKEKTQADLAIASIGPFWDANETWLVLSVGILLIAFPEAHSYILQQFYIPITIMLVGLILRGVAFDFRAKAAMDMRTLWDYCFRAGSLLASLTQGYMLGRYIVGFDSSWPAQAFSVLSALGVSAAYVYIGSTWLILKTDGALQEKAFVIAKHTGRMSLLGVVLVSIVSPMVNPGVFDRWFSYPLVMFVLLIPCSCFALFLVNDFLLGRFKDYVLRVSWLPFVVCMGIFSLCFIGIGFSFFPYVVPGKLTVWQAASAPESLRFILVGALFVIPAILAYTAFSYWVFRGKAKDLRYH